MFSTRRRFLKFLPVSALSALSVTSGPRLWGQNKPSASGTELRPVIVDADTANEVDDLFAIVRALIEPSFHVMGLTSAQWHTQDRAPNDTVGLSQKLNEDLLHLLDTKVPHPAGSNIPLVNPQRPQPSAAARHIISEAIKLPNGQKLTVFVLGHFWTFVGVFWDFSVFFLVMFFLVIRPIMWLRGQKILFFQDFLVVSRGYYAHFHAILALLRVFLDFFWRILGFFCPFSWLSFSLSNVL